jgi:hypothetical protein
LDGYRWEWEGFTRPDIWNEYSEVIGWTSNDNQLAKDVAQQIIDDIRWHLLASLHGASAHTLNILDPCEV